MHQLDADILLFLNHASANHPLLGTVVMALGDNSMARGWPFFASLIYLWFMDESVETRSRMLVGIVALSFALAASLVAQHSLTFHVRPIIDSSLDIANLLHWETSKFGKRRYSFPSDIAVLSFGLCATVFVINRSLGVVCYAWCIVTAGACRVALGVHYPSDILAGLVWGSAAVILADRVLVWRQAVMKMCAALDPKGRFANMFFVVFLLEAYSVFPGFEAALVVLVNALT